MKSLSFIPYLAFIAAVVSPLTAQFPIGDPPDATHPWGVHDWNRPQPATVEPGARAGDAPSDAVVLFDGTAASFENWVHTKPKDKRRGEWYIDNGSLVCQPGAGYIATKQHFGDIQLHVEWMAPPVNEDKAGQQRGNSGVFLLGQIEVQVLDNFNNPTYADGTAGAVYAVMPPAVNSLRGPGQWQSYDIIFRRPIIKDGVVIDEGSMTVLVNGVVVQDSTPLDGGGGYKKRKPLNQAYPDVGPLTLQDHGNPVRYRNIWYRPLRPRPVDGGTEGRLSETTTMAKRSEIAAGIRSEAQSLEGLAKIEKLLTAHVYLYEATAWAENDALVSAYLAQLEGASDEQINQQRWDILNLYHKLAYLEYHKIIDLGYAPTVALKAIADARDWLPKK
jgi:hypothetical protein